MGLQVADYGDWIRRRVGESCRWDSAVHHVSRINFHVCVVLSPLMADYHVRVTLKLGDIDDKMSILNRDNFIVYEAIEV